MTSQINDFDLPFYISIKPPSRFINISKLVLGWGLFFHTDLIRNTSLNLKMKDYIFFSYEISETLHLSEKEKQLLYECVIRIQAE